MPAYYAPLLTEWEGPRNTPTYGRRDALMALDRLLTALAAQGHPAVVASGYRSYDEQQRLHAREQTLWGRPVNLPPGCSQHQLGTAFDIAFPGMVVESLDPRAVAMRQALAELAATYGFVLPYLAPDLLAAEPWHILFSATEQPSN